MMWQPEHSGADFLVPVLWYRKRISKYVYFYCCICCVECIRYMQIYSIDVYVACLFRPCMLIYQHSVYTISSIYNVI